jgi:hypothetical protein
MDTVSETARDLPGLLIAAVQAAKVSVCGFQLLLEEEQPVLVEEIERVEEELAEADKLLSIALGRHQALRDHLRVELVKRRVPGSTVGNRTVFQDGDLLAK